MNLCHVYKSSSEVRKMGTSVLSGDALRSCLSKILKPLFREVRFCREGSLRGPRSHSLGAGFSTRPWTEVPPSKGELGISLSLWTASGDHVDVTQFSYRNCCGVIDTFDSRILERPDRKCATAKHCRAIDAGKRGHRMHQC